MQPAIYGCSGERLTPDERDFFKDANPAGYILFKRNCASKDQLRALTDALRELHGRELPILVDQEGGRVARLQPPVWPAFPSPQRFSDLYAIAPISAIEAARVNAQAVATVLREVGINVNCLPLLDLRHAGGSEIIAGRTLGAEPMQVAALGRAVIEGLRDGGVAAVVKHMPGHGRATCDSHFELPVVDAAEEALQADLEPFRALASSLIGMTAHVVYTVWDGEHCASLSATVIRDVIRGRIGFEGFLISDDIGMHALSGGFEERARGVIEAGCDVALHCSGDMAEMVAMASGLGDMRAEAQARLERAMASLSQPEGSASYEELAAKRDALLAYT